MCQILVSNTQFIERSDLMTLSQNTSSANLQDRLTKKTAHQLPIITCRQYNETIPQLTTKLNNKKISNKHSEKN